MSIPHILSGMRFAFGGAVAASGLFLVGIAVLAINIVILIKVIRMEKILKKHEEDNSLRQ
jgi:hypothetical protein